MVSTVILTISQHVCKEFFCVGIVQGTDGMKMNETQPLPSQLVCNVACHIPDVVSMHR